MHKIRATIGWILGVSGVIAAAAQAADPVASDVLIAYVPPPYVEGETRIERSHMLDDQTTWDVLSRRSGEFSHVWRWERFEAEFGIKEPEQSRVKSAIQLAKYKLDKTVFAVNEFVEEAEETIEFEYDLGRKDFHSKRSARLKRQEPERVYFSPLRDAMENAKLKSDIDWNLGSSRAFLGVSLVVPFGN